MLDAVTVVVALAAAAYLAFSPRLESSRRWAATITPLASIMGSGFLVSAPLLAGIVGNLAILCMALLLALAYGVGEAMRFNIRHFEPIEDDGPGAVQWVALTSRIVLAGAYFISISYYLQLLAAFALDAAGLESGLGEHVICTALLVVICGVGIWRGLTELGALERYTVSLNLGIIGALLVGLAFHNAALLARGEWALPDVDSTIDLHDLRILLGLLIVVQGFETSRYLGDEFSAARRARTMRLAQITSSAIYLAFVALATVLFRGDLGGRVTAIIGMTRPIAAALPLLLAVAAVGSQFSAAVADTEGAGGLIEDLTHQRLSTRHTYMLVLLLTATLTWATDVNRIIAYASRAFALYYALQCSVATFLAARAGAGHRTRTVLFGATAALCATVFAFGLPAE